MYVIINTKTMKVLRTWSLLEMSPVATRTVARRRDELASTYPDDVLIVMTSVEPPPEDPEDPEDPDDSDDRRVRGYGEWCVEDPEVQP